MKFKSLFVALLVWIVSAAAAQSMTVKDMAGRTVDLAAQPQRIICLGPGALRLIVYLQAQDRLVGVESMERRFPAGRPYWLAQPQLNDLPVIGPGGAGAINKKPDMEAVLKVAPDLIVATYMDAGLADKVAETLGIPVMVLSYGELAVFDTTVYDSLRLAGRVLQKEARADAVIGYIEGLRTDLIRRTADIPDEAKPRVFVGGIGHRGSHGIESTQRDYIPLDWNHAVNVAQQIKATVGSHVLVDRELLMELDPEVIFIDGGGLALVKADYRKKPDFYRALKAFREQRVYALLPFNHYTTNIDTAMADAYAIGKVLYPRRFADVDLVRQADSIYTFLVGHAVADRMQAEFAPLGQPIAFDYK